MLDPIRPKTSTDEAISALAHLLVQQGAAHGGLLSLAHVAEVKRLVRACLEAGVHPEQLPRRAIAPPADPKGCRFAVMHGTPAPKFKSDKKYDCPYCKHPNKFWDGWIILCEDGWLRLIGDDCKVHHIDQRIIDTAFDTYRTENLAEFYRAALPDLYSCARATYLELHPYLTQSDQRADWDCWYLREQFIEELPELVRYVRHAHSTGATLFVRERVLSVKKSEANNNTDGDNQFVWVERALHILHGAMWLSADTRAPERQLALATKRLAHVIHDTNEVLQGEASSKSITVKARASLKNCRVALEMIADARTVIVSALAFMSRDNIEGICLWANHRSSPLNDSSYESLRFGIRREDMSGDPVEIQLPDGYVPPTFSSLDKLKTAVQRCERLTLRRSK